MDVEDALFAPMGKDTSIEWTHHTFNPWWGCAKVSPACQNCYAESWAKRAGADVWGAKAERRFFGEKHWRQPLDWNALAAKEQQRKRVFCASMADVFESRSDLDFSRQKVWNLIGITPWLDWLLLTKRPENVGDMAPWGSEWPRNVWVGSTVETQEWAEKRLPSLLELPAANRFLSCEPLLGKLDLSMWFHRKGLYPINWVIAGGESGHHARPVHPQWVRSLRNQCVEAKVPFHFKQWGHWQPQEGKADVSQRSQRIIEGSGEPVIMVATGKKIAGRLLDGKTWDGMPTAAL